MYQGEQPGYLPAGLLGHRFNGNNAKRDGVRRVKNHDFDAVQLAELEDELATESKEPVLCDDDQSSHAPEEDSTQQALQTFFR